jgi:hypothetical protein
MKLSRQERIGAFVIAIIVILAVGIFVFIKPRVETINTTTLTLTNKQQELDTAVAKAATKDDLKQQVLDAYNEGENMADMFFTDMTQYEAEAEFRAFLEQCEAKIAVEDLTVSTPSTATLAPSYFTESEVTYALKSYVTQGVDSTEEETAAANRLAILQDALGSSQTVGAITISFTVSAIDEDELLKFVDEVNSYYKDENGTSTRKALKINGYSREYTDIENEYNELIEEIQAKAQTDGTKELYSNFGKSVPSSATTTTSTSTTTATTTDENGETTTTTTSDSDTINLSDNLFSMSSTLTFYSVARMQDPSDQLDQQDGLDF